MLNVDHRSVRPPQAFTVHAPSGAVDEPGRSHPALHSPRSAARSSCEAQTTPRPDACSRHSRAIRVSLQRTTRSHRRSGLLTPMRTLTRHHPCYQACCVCLDYSHTAMSHSCRYAMCDDSVMSLQVYIPVRCGRCPSGSDGTPDSVLFGFSSENFSTGRRSSRHPPRPELVPIHRTQHIGAAQRAGRRCALYAVSCSASCAPAGPHRPYHNTIPEQRACTHRTNSTQHQ